MSEKEADSWKEKYHSSLDHFKEVEKEWQGHVNLVKHTLARVTVIAQEVAPSLEEEFAGLRNTLRQTEDHQEIEEAIEALNETIDKADSLTETRIFDTKDTVQILLTLLKCLSLPKQLSKTLVLLVKETELMRETYQQHEIILKIQAVADEILNLVKSGEVIISPPKGAVDFLKKIIKGDEINEIPEEMNLPQYLNEQLLSVIAHIGVTEEQYELANGLLTELEQGISLPRLLPFVDQLADLVAELAREDNDKLESVCEEFRKQLDESRAFLEHLDTFVEKHQKESKVLNKQVTKSIQDLRDSLQSQPKEVQQMVNKEMATICNVVAGFQSTSQALLNDAMSKVAVLSTQLEQSDKTIEALHEHVMEKRFGLQKDALTQLPNRQAYEDYIKREIQRSLRTDSKLCFVVADIDHFKRVNDNFGHDCGDRAIIGCAKLLKDTIRESDFIARFGGEEYVIILPDTDTQAGLSVCEKVRETVAGAPFSFQGENVTITMSFGITQLIKDDTPETLFKRADKALYAAKHAGRNRVSLG